MMVKRQYFFVLILSFSLFFIPSLTKAVETILIVEVQIAGASSNNDFIKIYNPTNNDLDIGSFKLRKKSSTSSESSIRAFPQGSKILANGYFLWTNSENNFANSLSADVSSKATLAKNNSVAILNSEGVILDSLAWGESSNPFVEEQSFPENPEPNQRLTRKQGNGIYQDTNNNNQDFYLNPPSQPSSLQEEGQKDQEPSSQEKAKSQVYAQGIIINELLPSPLGTDEQEEWIELFNKNSFEVDLSDWQLQDKIGTTANYIIPEGIKISPQGFLIFQRPATKIVLNNDGDSVSLLQPDGALVETVGYENAPEGQSFARQASEWSWTTTITPGKVNIITKIEREAKKEIVEKTEEKPGETEGSSTAIYPSGIFINEILPSPTGPDEQEEWIEIFNSNNSEGDISGWQISDTDGKTKNYVFPEETKITSQGFLVLKRLETKIVLNNDADGLKLVNPNGNIVDQVSYEKAPTGQSYNRTASGWAWSENLTPGAQNVVPQGPEEEEEKEETSEVSEKGLATIGQNFPKIPQFALISLIALLIAVFFSIAILVLKKILSGADL
jgi:hypothetical protein